MIAVKWNRDRASITIDRHTVTMLASDVTKLVRALSGGGLGHGCLLPGSPVAGDAVISEVHSSATARDLTCVWVGKRTARSGHTMVKLTPAERDTLIAQLRSGGNR